METKKSIYVTVPNHKGWIHKHTHFAICRILCDGRYKIRSDCPTHSPYVQNLHICMHDFLNGGEDFWISMDDDNPPQNNPLDLIQLDLDLIGLPTPVWHNSTPGDRPYYLNALDSRGEDGYAPHEPCDGLQEVDCIGSGCFVVKREVMMALQDQQPFMRQWRQDGLVERGGDFSFCEKVKAKGFKIWAHYDYLCHHFNEVDLLEVIKAFWNLYNKDNIDN